MWPFRRPAPPAEQLGRACRQLGEMLAAQASTWGTWNEIAIEFTRPSPGDLPAVRGTISRGTQSEAYRCPAELAAISASLARLGGNYRRWHTLAVRFRPDQLPIPVGISVRPDLHA